MSGALAHVGFLRTGVAYRRRLFPSSIFSQTTNEQEAGRVGALVRRAINIVVLPVRRADASEWGEQ